MRPVSLGLTAPLRPKLPKWSGNRQARAACAEHTAHGQLIFFCGNRKRAGSVDARRKNHLQKHSWKNTLGKTLEIYPMRKLILAATALAFLSSAASAQTPDKAGSTSAPAAQSSDSTSKADAPKTKMASKKKTKKPAKTSSEDAK